MATQIKRVRFFDGQFLKQVDFRDEQLYHMHLRRRMNFFLFEKNGVVAIGPDDLKLEIVNAAAKTFRVRAGMAIGRNDGAAEGKELILPEDSAAIDLDDRGIAAGGTAFISLHFVEQAAKDPPSEGDVDEDTRFRENAVVEVHPSMPPALAANGEPYIVLGSIAYDTMAISATSRHEAKLRSSLIAVAPVPIVSSVGGTTTVAAGAAAVAMVINGVNLSGASAVLFSDPAVTAVVTASSPNTLNVNVTAAAGASAGPKSFQVVTPAGVGSSPGGVVFTVTGAIPAPALTGINLHALGQGGSISAVITGTNLGAATGVSFAGTGVTATIDVGGTPTSLPLTITAISTAALGARVFTVTTPGGSASSAALGAAGAFLVVAPVQVVNLIPASAPVGASVKVLGFNLHNGSSAGVSARLRKGNVSVATATPTVLPNEGAGDQFQALGITIPARAPGWAPSEQVFLEVFSSGTGAPVVFTYPGF
jgi:hypothetical protein